jgi:cell division FtsZ-interacting protein ZapD
MEIKDSQLKEIETLLAESESLLDQEVVDQDKLESVSKQLDFVLAEFGNYKRFFKRLT